MIKKNDNKCEICGKPGVDWMMDNQDNKVWVCDDFECLELLEQQLRAED